MKITNKYLKQIIQEETQKLILEDNRTVGSLLDSINTDLANLQAKSGSSPVVKLIQNMFLILDAIAPREKPIGLGGDSNAAAGAQPGEGDPSYGQQLPPPGHPSHESDPP